MAGRKTIKALKKQMRRATGEGRKRLEAAIGRLERRDQDRREAERREAAERKAEERKISLRAAERARREIAASPGTMIDGFLRRQMLSLAREPRIFGKGFRRTMYEDAGKFLHMLPERHYGMWMRDFAETAARGLLAEGAMTRLAALPEKILHNYSPVERGREIEFDDGAGNRFVFAGFAVVRRETRVYWTMLGGPVDQRIEIDEDAVVLENESDVQRLSAAGFFDLKDGAFRLHDVRIERKKGPPVILEEERPWMPLAESMARLALRLPAYVALKVVMQRPAVTAAGEETTIVTPEPSRERMAAANSDAKAPADETSKERTRRRRAFLVVSALRIETDGEPSVGMPRKWTEPAYRVEVAGYFKPIAPTSVGKDAEGRPVVGRTWVPDHERYKNKPRRAEPRIKAPVLPAAEYAAEAAEADPETKVSFRI